MLIKQNWIIIMVSHLTPTMKQKIALLEGEPVLLKLIMKNIWKS